MRLTNLTRSNEIGANSYLLEMEGSRVLLDAGMHPRKDGPEGTPLFKLLRDKPLDAIFLTHAHLDHLGALPVAMREHRGASVFMSQATAALADPLLRNSVNIMKKRALSSRDPHYQLYQQQDVDRMVKRFDPCELNRSRGLDGAPKPAKGDVSFEFYDAGHIMGSVAVKFESSEGSVVYTGDINFTDQTLSKKTNLTEEKVDALIIETTRGANPSPEGVTRETELKRLGSRISAVLERGGTVLIPVFALGKTQEALAALHFMMRNGEIPLAPVHIGGLSWRLSETHDQLRDLTPRFHSHLSLLDHVKPRMTDGRSARQIDPKRGNIYLLSSGMMNENTLSNILASRFLCHEKDAIFFIGYTDPSSPAGKLRVAAQTGARVELETGEGLHPILCEVDHFDLTAHAQREDLLDYILKSQPRHTVLVHGDAPALEWFKQSLSEKAPQMKVSIPPPGEPLDL